MKPRMILAGIALAAIALGAFAGAYLFHRPAPELQSGTVLPSPRPVGEFALVDQAHRGFGRERLKGNWSLVFAGFTHCPDICPTTLSLLKQLNERLSSGTELQTVFLSVDPARDTPELLAAYLGAFDSTFVGLSGPAAEVDKLCSSLGLGYVKNPGENGDYTVDHSGALVLIDPQARVAAYFQPPFDVARLAADLGSLSTER